MQAFILNKTSFWKTGLPEFTHYWINDGSDFPDVSNFDQYLENFKDENNKPTYEWVEIDASRIFRGDDIMSVYISISSDEVKEWKDVFIKIQDGAEIPMYYYNVEIQSVTNQNEPILKYKMICEFDMWSTFGCKMHKLMKDDNMIQHFLCNRKMMNRFKYEVYNEITKEWEPCNEFINDGKHRLGLNYITQPWLLNTGNYEYPLIQATDDLTEEKGDIVPLKLEDWLEMNGCDSEKLARWEANGAISTIYCKEEYSKTDKSGGQQKGKDNYKYNNNRVHLKSTDMPLINDSYFNSKGKYRYMVVKFGSNNTWSYKLDSTDTAKMTAYSKAREQLAKYPDLQTLLSDVVLGGGKTCITTKKVETNKSNTDEYVATHLNGEAICLIPIPKGQFEQLYLFYLNSHDKGIVLGNGTILGMVVNDIPPSVFAAALRKYNNNLNNADMQTIGDKVSLHNDNELGELPFAWTSLRLDGVWDWNENRKNALYARDDTYCIRTSVWIPGTEEQPGYNHITYRLRDNIPQAQYYFDTEKVSGDDIAEWEFVNKWAPPMLYGNDEYPFAKTMCKGFANYNGGTVYDKSNWSNPLFAHYDTPKWAKSGVKKVNLVEIIPPTSSIIGEWYHLSSEDANIVYLNTDSKHYFPTIFHDFSYIPITVAHKDETTGKIKGQGSWFNVFENMLTDPEIYGTNNRWSDPYLWGPQFYQWVYYTDGLAKITLTADQVDWFKTYKPTWNINLRTNMSSTTNLKLDIDDIINENYPFSKSTSEFILTDPNKYPFTTEAYNNWYEQHAVSENTAKRAKDITNEFAKAKYPISAGLNMFSSAMGGAGAGAILGPWGALGGLVAGLGAGSGAWSLGKKKLNLEIQEADKQWANEWARTYGNLYAQPARIESDGFTSGSLLYTPNGEATDSFELFRMFTINPEARDAIGEDVFTSGYPYMKMCEYKDYDNRKKFNIVHFNLSEKNAIVNHYLKKEMSKNTLLFSQQEFIDWFKAKCKTKIRLFKGLFNYDNMDELIKNNIENDMKI